MSPSATNLHDLPSPFYRVAVKALIFDDQNRLAIVVNEYDKAELPGGGWEHDETFEECLRREIDEEMGAVLRMVGPTTFTFRGVDRGGWHVFRVVAQATIETCDHLQPKDDGIRAIRFVTKEEFLKLNCEPADRGMLEFVDTIWSEIKE